MTDLNVLTELQFERVEWQTVAEDVTKEDLSTFIFRGIRDLYVKTGRSSSFREDMFVKEEDVYVSFEEDLPLDEEEYVLVVAEIFFLQKVQSTVDQLTSYSTDALSVTHGDKPFANLQQRITDLKNDRREIWYKMTRYHHL